MLHKGLYYLGWLAISAWLLVACQPDGDVTRIEFWAMGREGEVIRQFVPIFERQHPDIRVKVQQIPWGAAHEKLLTAFAGNNLPDVFQLGSTWLPEFVALNALSPLEGYFASLLAEHDYFSGIQETNATAGHLYGVSWYVDTRLFFYRPDLLAQIGVRAPPSTWSEWMQLAQRIRQQSGGQRFALLAPFSEWQLPVILALQQGAPLLRENDSHGAFSQPAFQRAFHFYLELYRQHLVLALGETQIANLYQEFARGFFAFYISGPWNIGEFKARLPAALQTVWRTAPLPDFQEGGIGLSLAGGASLVIARQSHHQEAARQWVTFLTEPAQQAALYRSTGDLPARRSAWEMEGLPTHPLTQAFWQQLEHLAAIPKIPEWERIAAKLAQYGESAIRGEFSENEALRRLDADVDQILEKRRWLLQRRDFPRGQ